MPIYRCVVKGPTRTHKITRAAQTIWSAWVFCLSRAGRNFRVGGGNGGHDVLCLLQAHPHGKPVRWACWVHPRVYITVSRNEVKQPPPWSICACPWKLLWNNFIPVSRYWYRTAIPSCLVGSAATSPQISGTYAPLVTPQTKRRCSHLWGGILPVVASGGGGRFACLEAVMAAAVAEIMDEVFSPSHPGGRGWGSHPPSPGDGGVGGGSGSGGGALPPPPPLPDPPGYGAAAVRVRGGGGQGDGDGSVGTCGDW